MVSIISSSFVITSCLLFPSVSCVIWLAGQNMSNQDYYHTDLLTGLSAGVLASLLFPVTKA